MNTIDTKTLKDMSDRLYKSQKAMTAERMVVLVAVVVVMGLFSAGAVQVLPPNAKKFQRIEDKVDQVLDVLATQHGADVRPGQD